MFEYHLDTALKLQQWEIAKGHLRALVKLQGSYSTTSDRGDVWQKLDEVVEKFIDEVEDNELQA